MKTTFKYIFAIVSLFAFSSAAFAQSGTGEEPEQKYEGVHAEKSATYDFTTQKGEITLESFVEGFIKPAEQKPLDVVFVWDATGAMDAQLTEGKAKDIMGDIVSSFVEQVQKKVAESRFGLVTFRQDVVSTCSLTSNISTFESKYPTAFNSNGSGMNKGIDWALDEFGRTPRPDGQTTQNIIILITGGAGNVPDYVSNFTEFKKKGGIVVSVLVPKDKGYDQSYMEHMSSNYPNATSNTNLGPKNDKPIYYLYTQVPSDFTDFFDALAESITSVPDMGPTVMTKDVLSPSFMLPEGTTLDDISAYAVPCTGLVFDESGDVKDYIFAGKDSWKRFEITEGEYAEGADKSKVYGKITTDKNGNDQLELTGFDYKSNFCGPYYNEDGSKTDPKGKKYDVVGYKFVITLPIVLSSGNAASLTTNTEESGLYAQNGDQIAFFPLPEVYFAYITIVKKGLAQGESALFKVSKTIKGVTSEVCQVALTGDGNESVSKGIYAGMFEDGDTFTVAELTEWGWTYNLSGMKLEVGDAEIDDGIFEMIADDPTTEKVEGNEGKNAVFTFTNAKKEGITVKNAENAKLNHLKQGSVDGGVSSAGLAPYNGSAL